MVYSPSNNKVPEVTGREHDTKNTPAKRVSVFGYLPGSDDLVRLTAVDNGDGTYSLKTTAVVTSESPASTGTTSSVNDTATSTTLIAANTSRKEVIIQNDSSSVLYVKFGTTASATDYTAKLYTDDLIRTDFTGRIDGIWASDSTGAARLTELT